MQQTRPKHNKVYRIVDGQIETIKVLYEEISPDGVTVLYCIEHKDGGRAQCCEDMYPKTQSDAWQEWANERIEGILTLKEGIRNSQDLISHLNKELVGY